MKRTKYTLILFFLVSNPIFSQNSLGLSGSNFVGTNALSFNPAHVVDTKHHFFIHLAGVGADVQNDFLRWTAPFSFTRFITNSVSDTYRNPVNNKIMWQESYLKRLEGRRSINAFINAEGRGPAVAFDNKKAGIGMAAGVRYRFLTSLTKSSDEIGQLLVEGTRSPTLLAVNNSNRQFYFNSSFINEYFLSFGKVFINEQSRVLKVGLTGKYYVSDLFSHLSAKDVDFTISSNLVSPAKQTINLMASKGQLALASQATSMSANQFLSQMKKIDGLGKGFGIDLGFVFEYKPDNDEKAFERNANYANPNITNYLFKVGFSVVDLGFLTYSDKTLVKMKKIESVNNSILPGTYNSISGYEELINTTLGVYATDTNRIESQFKNLMPATLVATFDYHLLPHVFFNVVLRQYLLSASRMGVLGYSGISFVPRYEKKNYAFSVPMSLDNHYNNLHVGFSARLYGFFIGSDNIGGWLNLLNPRDLSVYAGLFLPIYQRSPQSPLKCYVPEKVKLYRKKKGMLKKIGLVRNY